MYLSLTLELSGRGNVIKQFLNLLMSKLNCGASQSVPERINRMLKILKTTRKGYHLQIKTTIRHNKKEGEF